MPVQAAKLAFVLGNENYGQLSDLRNAHEDARAYSEAFGDLGYAVSYHQDLDLGDTIDALDSFLNRISFGDEVVIVYSGHGWSDGATNYLIPTDAPRQGSDRVLERRSIALKNGLNGILDEVEAAGASLTVAIIDACRNNPFEPPAGRKSIGMTRGLAPVKAATGTFVIFSAGEGQEALDRLPSDPPGAQMSVFTRTFLPQLKRGIFLEDAIAKAQVETARLALDFDGHLQHPAYYDQTLGYTCLTEDCGTATAAVVQPEPDSLCDLLYAEAKGAPSCFAFDGYLQSCGTHPFRGNAEAYLKRNCQVQVAAVAPPKVQPEPQPKAVVTPPTSDVTMSKSLNLVSWGGAYQRSQQRAYTTPYADKNAGLSITWHENSFEAVSLLSKAKAAGNDLGWDLVDVVATDAIRLCDKGLVMEINPDAFLAPAPDGNSASSDFGPFLVSDCAIPQIVYSSVVAYRTDLVGNRPPRDICALFDLDGYPGKRALEKRPNNNLEWALLCDGVPHSDIYELLATNAGQRRALAKLDTIKDHVIWWQAGAETPQLLADGEVVMGSSWNGRFFSLIEEQKQPVAMLWDAQVLDLDVWVIPTGLSAERLARVRDFLWFATDTQRLADQAKYIAYGPARASSAEFVGFHADLGVDMAAHIPTAAANMRNAFVYNYDFWARHSLDLNDRFAAWLAE